MIKKQMHFKFLKLTIIIVLNLSTNLGNAATWIVGTSGDSWMGNVTYDNIKEIQATGCIELRKLVDDYVSYWRFDNNSMQDENTINGNDGINYGCTYNENGKYGGCFNLNGIDDYVKISDNSSLDMTDSITLVAWVNPANIVGDKTIIWKTESYVFSIENDSLWGYIYDLNNTIYKSVRALNIITSNEWQHIAFTYNKTLSSNNLKLYKNCIQEGQDNETSSINISTNNLMIGKKNNDTWFYNGALDDLRIYNRSLSSTEIEQIMNNAHYDSGNLTSAVRDAKSLGNSGNVWKQISFNAIASANTRVDLYVKTSFDDGVSDPWTEWTLVQTNALSGAIYDLPLQNRERHGQWKMELKTSDVSATPAIKSVTFTSGSVVILKAGQKIAVGPNPFTPGHPPYDKVSFNVENPQNEKVTLEIYNLESRLVFKKQFNPTETIYWDGTNSRGRQAKDGIYIYQVKVGNATHTGKVVLAR